MHDDATATATPEASQETGALIDHILTHYHEMHRADLASLVPLAERVEQVHADDPDAPTGLARALATLAREMEDHMAKEELILFPAMRAGGGAGIEHPIAVMRADHDDHAATIARIRKLTGDLTPPEHACGSWRSLYGGTATLLDELAAHIALENDVLFPRFETAR
jgi:regulator of cell morphogenesis and NO signaling